MDALTALRRRVGEVLRVAESRPVMRWGTVTQSLPLRVRLDGRVQDVIPVTPPTLIPVLSPGERVLCFLQDSQLVVLQVAGRGRGVPEGTAAQMNALGVSGAALEGMRWWNTTDSREYVYTGGAWDSGDTGWLTITPPTGATGSTLLYRVAQGLATIRWSVVLDTALTAGTQRGITTAWVPAALRPPAGFDFPLACAGAGNQQANAVITAAGELWLRNTSSVSITTIAMSGAIHV